MRKLEKKTKKTSEAMKMKLKTDTAQTQTAIRTATSLSWTTLDTAVIEAEDWIEFMKRSTDEAMEKMNNTKSNAGSKTYGRMKWILAMRIASVPVERWLVSAVECNPELSTKKQNLQRRRKTQKEDGKMRSTNSSSLKKLKRQQEMTWSITARGSKWQET